MDNFMSKVAKDGHDEVNIGCIRHLAGYIAAGNKTKD